MRIIDADALIDKLMNAIECGRRADMPTQELEAVLSDVRNAPSIDIVRCKECKHNPWNTDADYTCIWDDDFADRQQTPDDFCSYGERKVDE